MTLLKRIKAVVTNQDIPGWVGWLAVATAVGLPLAVAANDDFQFEVEQAQAKIVKLFGAGGLRGLEAYQSGVLVSSDGHILTVWSYVLDGGQVTALLDDGRRFQTRLIGFDPRLEIAVLKIESSDLPHFVLDNYAPAQTGSRILAFSNLFGIATGNEAVSVQQGFVSAHGKLSARRGAFATAYDGPVYFIDAVTNNPGAAGGAVTNGEGQIVGMIGKEWRGARSGRWINFAIPIPQLMPALSDILAGRSSGSPLDCPIGSVQRVRIAVFVGD